MRRRLALCLAIVLISCRASTTTIYRDTWQPLDVRDVAGRPRLLVTALSIDTSALDAIRQAGATLIGYHATHGGWALRAGSTGGTHFIPISAVSTDRTNCTALQPTDWLSFSRCASQTTSHWTRVAVFRVEPSRWHELPVWLIPPLRDVVRGVAYSAARDGCQAHRGDGTVRCGGAWTIVARRAVARSSTAASAAGVQQPTPAPPDGASPRLKLIGIGTGFAIDNQGFIVTAHHVVRQNTAVAVMFAGTGEVLPATIVRSSADADLALLQIARPPPDFVSISVANAAAVGQPVFTIGFPDPELLGAEPKFTDGSISALSGFGTDPRLLQISVPIQPGNSGGPLLNDAGQVVGIVISSAAADAFYGRTGALPQNINYASKSDNLRWLLSDRIEQLPVQPATASRQEAVARASRAVCIVGVFGSE